LESCAFIFYFFFHTIGDSLKEGGFVMNKLVESFLAFNQNAANHLVYFFSTNLSSLLIVISAAAFVFLYLKEEIALSTREEQNIL